MAVSSLASAASLASTSAASASSASTAANSLGLSQADFMQLLTTQMQYQDPANPVSSTDLITQLSQFSNVQGMQQLNSTITQMLTLQQVTQAANMIGKQISFTTSGNSLGSTGTVSSVQVSNGQVQLMVGGQSVALSQVTSISAGAASK
jgi:flagellar basal-body rod modification protein FlgD